MTSQPGRIADADLAAAAAQYVRLIGDGDETGALALVSELRAVGVPAEQILTEVVGSAQAQVGQFWAENHWPVAREHLATVVSERVLTVMGERESTPASRGRVTVACVDGEWHALPVRIVAEVLRLRGWRVDFLGANVPGPSLMQYVQYTDPDTVALSCMLPVWLPRAHAAVVACQRAGVPVLTGGPGFGAAGRYARRFGANAWAPDAYAAADLLAARDWPPAQVMPADPPYLPGPEYGQVTVRRAELVGTGVHRLAGADPAAERGATPGDDLVEELAQAVDFLAAALYVGDETVFTDYVAWTVALHAARDLPSTVLERRLEVLAHQVSDLPESTRIFALARSAAARPPG